MTSNPNSKKNGKSSNDKLGAGIAIGVGVGLAIGAALGNPGAGLAMPLQCFSRLGIPLVVYDSSS